MQMRSQSMPKKFKMVLFKSNRKKNVDEVKIKLNGK